MTIQTKSTSCATQEKTKNPSIASDITPPIEHPLRAISAEEFVDLGVGHVVFVRSISVKELRLFVPEAQSMPAEVQFQMIVGANGAPIVIADNSDAIEDWFEQNSVRTVLRH